MKFMKLGRDDSCVVCTVATPVGTWAHWNATDRTVTCVDCQSFVLQPVGAVKAVMRAPAAPKAMATDVLPASIPATEVVVEVDVAGRSALTEYNKRSVRERARTEQKINADAVWRVELRERRPILGRVVAAMTPKPTHGPESQSTKAWNTGAEGERRVAEVLASVSGIEILHDRLAPGRGSANIDHIVVAPSGVFVIDAKKYSGCLEVRDKGSMFRTDERLYVNGRDRTALLDGVRRQVADVRTVLGDEWDHIPVRPALCFIGCEWTRLKEKNLGGVAVVWPKALPKLVSADGPHRAQADALATLLRRLLKPAK